MNKNNKIKIIGLRQGEKNMKKWCHLVTVSTL